VGRSNYIGSTSVRILVAAVLIGAALLKVVAAAPTTSLIIRIGSCAIPSVECYLAIWLLSGASPSFSWTLSGLCFFVFAEVSLINALADRESCGCFGAVKVSPSLMCALDFLALAAILYFHPGRSPAGPVHAMVTWSWRLAPLVAAVLAVLVWAKTEPGKFAVSASEKSYSYLLSGEKLIAQPWGFP
jgi:hypothetical protein